MAPALALADDLTIIRRGQRHRDGSQERPSKATAGEGTPDGPSDRPLP